MYCFISKKHYTYCMKKKIFTAVIILVYGIGMLWIGFYMGELNFRPTPFAQTNNLQIANEIQSAITNYRYPTVLYVDGSKYYIEILSGTKNYIDYAAVELAEKDIITDEVFIQPNFNPYLYITSTKPKKLKKLQNLFNKNLSKRLSHVEGVYSAQTDIKMPDSVFFLYNQSPATANIIIKTNKAFDLERISSTIKTLLVASVPTLTKDNIKINFEFEECDNKCLAKTYYKQAKRAIKIDKNYDKALKNLQNAQKLNPDYYSTDCLMKLIELNKNIAQNPANDKLYIARGDLQNVEEYSMFVTCNITSDYQAAIDDYQKALELNPKAYEVYEKLGDAYSEIGWRKCDVCKLERDIQDDWLAIDYYQKAIKHLGGNDVLYKKLGDRYRAVEDKQKADETYAKIKNKQILENENIPKPDGFKPLKHL